MIGKLAKLAATTERRCPAATMDDRRSTARFLVFFERRINRALDALRQLSLTDNADALKGQVAYHRNQLSTIRWLQAMNAKRRTLDETESPG